jgi:hypothetical protein
MEIELPAPTNMLRDDVRPTTTSVALPDGDGTVLIIPDERWIHLRAECGR